MNSISIGLKKACKDKNKDGREPLPAGQVACEEATESKEETLAMFLSSICSCWVRGSVLLLFSYPDLGKFLLIPKMEKERPNHHGQIN